MTDEPMEKWDDMDEQTQQEIKARLAVVIMDAERAEYRGRLARGSRSGLTAREKLAEVFRGL